MAGRSQQESEQPAKVYQLDAVESKVDDALSKLDTVIKQTSGLVTMSELSAVEKKLTEKIDEEISSLDQKVELTYGPMKRNITWLLRTFIAAIIAQIVAVVFVFYNWMVNHS